MQHKNKILSITSKQLKISPTKLKIFVDKIRFKTYTESIEILKTLSQRTSTIILNLFKTLLAPICKDLNLLKEKFFLFETYINKSTILIRPHPRAKGKMNYIQKKFSYITLSICLNVEYILLEFLYLLLLKF
jgi:ribosomal protein L22